MNEPDSDHLTPEQVAGILERTLAQDERRRLNRHLASCAECRAGIVSAHRVLATKRKKNLRMVFLPLVAVATIVVLLLRFPIIEADRDSLRSEGAEGLETQISIRIYGPGDTLQAAVPSFVWGSAAEGVRYQLVLTRADGAEVWSAGTSDTVLAFPPDIELDPGDYYWNVDALLLDGRTATSGIRRLTVSP